jgi:hypothetical protein
MSKFDQVYPAIFGYAIHDGALKLKQYGSGQKYEKKDEEKNAFRQRAKEALNVINNQLVAFDHLWLVNGVLDLGIKSMSQAEFYQYVNLFFRHGLHWELDHPALQGFDFPELTMSKLPSYVKSESKKNKASKAKAATQRKKEEVGTSAPTMVDIENTVATTSRSKKATRRMKQAPIIKAKNEVGMTSMNSLSIQYLYVMYI